MHCTFIVSILFFYIAISESSLCLFVYTAPEEEATRIERKRKAAKEKALAEERAALHNEWTVHGCVRYKHEW